jgi:hypothetical protein
MTEITYVGLAMEGCDRTSYLECDPGYGGTSVGLLWGDLVGGVCDVGG